MKTKKKEKLLKALHPVEEEVFNLLEMFEFFLDERQLGKPIEMLADSVRDLRIIIQQLLFEYFLGLSKSKEEAFIVGLAKALAKRSERIPVENKEDKRYVKYCISEVLTSFEWAVEIKKEFPEDQSTQRILAMDIPVLRPFDYGLRSKIRLVAAPKKKPLMQGA
jgi:hypothetical protein